MSRPVGRPRKYDRAADAATIQPWLDQGFSLERAAQVLGWKLKRTRHAAKIARGNQDSSPRRSSTKVSEASKPEVVQEPKAPKEKKKPVRISFVEERDAALAPGRIHRIIVTSAQDDTPVWTPFWTNLLAYAHHTDANLAVGGYTYQLGLYEDHAVATAVYASELSNHLEFGRVRLTDSLLSIGDANILPTTSNPLTGWLTANRGGHVILPHARVAMDSIPRMQGRDAHFAISTGTCTMPSYTPRASGRKALFHHTFAALMVEIDVDGKVFFRHLTADRNGDFQDLTTRVRGGRVLPGSYSVEGITYGDIHFEGLDPAIARATWGYDVASGRRIEVPNLHDTLRPSYAFFHDTLDFRGRNHHDRNDPHSKVKIRQRGLDSVEDAVRGAAGFLQAVNRDWCQAVFVESNHDDALTRWLKSPDGMNDPDNAYYWHRLNARWHDALRRGDYSHNPVRDAFVEAGMPSDIDFVGQGESYEVAGIECGLHGHVGPNGARGGPQQFRRMAPKVNGAHAHTARILDGYFCAGMNGKLRQGYNETGPTSWSPADIVIYSDGNRAIINKMADGRHRGGMDASEFRMAA